MPLIIFSRFYLYWQHIVIIFHDKVKLSLSFAVEIVQGMLIPRSLMLIEQFNSIRLLYKINFYNIIKALFANLPY